MTFHNWKLLKTEILRRAFGNQPFTAADAREAWGIRNVDSTLHRLRAAGIIERVARGVYMVSPDDRPIAIGQALEAEQIQATRRARDADLPRLAKARWDAWIADGFVTPLGPNRFRITPRTEQGGVRVRLR